MLFISITTSYTMVFISNVLCLLLDIYHTFVFFSGFLGVGNDFYLLVLSSVSLLSSFIETLSFFCSWAPQSSLIEIQCQLDPLLMIVLAKTLAASCLHHERDIILSVSSNWCCVAVVCALLFWPSEFNSVGGSSPVHFTRALQMISLSHFPLLLASLNL